MHEIACKKYGCRSCEEGVRTAPGPDRVIDKLLKPIAMQLKKEVIASEVIFTDDTPVTIAQDSNSNSRKGRVWIYLDRAGRHFYDFAESRVR